jgi:spermidine synthase
MYEQLSHVSSYVAFFLILSAGGFVSLFVIAFYRDEVRNSRSAQQPRWTARWDFTLHSLGGYSYLRLILVSALGLFLELLMIRWISSEIRVFAYLKNYVLVSCFLGFGLGCYLCRRKINLIAFLVPLVTLVFLLKFPWEPLRNLMSALPSYLGTASEVNYFGIPTIPLTWISLMGLFAAIAVTVPLFILNAMVFVPIGQIVGGFLEGAPRGIVGYSFNIVGGLAGILLFTLLSFRSQPPIIWFGVAGALLFLLLYRDSALRWTSALAFVICMIIVGGSLRGSQKQFWSPYQMLTLIPRVEAGETVSFQLDTNHTWFQQVVNLSPEFTATHPQFFSQVPSEWDAYNIPYHFYRRPSSVLVLGSGMGNDVAAAVRNGAERVVAVEIDPLIIQLGRELHFEHPYSSPRVSVVTDDARSYVQNSGEHFDLIVYSLLDSHTNLSHYSAVRIDNYVYTIEALQAARRLLKDDGILILKFQTNTPWIAGRLSNSLERVFGRPPLDFWAPASSYSTGGRFFVAGSAARMDGALQTPEIAAYIRVHGDISKQYARPTTDDWPYFYQHEPGLPLVIIIVSLLIVGLSRMLIRHTGMAGRLIHRHFFFLGAGFLLLESQIISRMALLFGTTWLVNAVVIAVLFLLILAANSLVGIWPGISVRFAYLGIGASVLVSYFLPTSALMFNSFWTRALAGTLVLCLPAAFASIVFIRSFASAGFNAEALGSNLFGAVVGGMLEAVSMWTGIRSLVILAGILYLASYVYLPGEQRQLAFNFPSKLSLSKIWKWQGAHLTPARKR